MPRRHLDVHEDNAVSALHWFEPESRSWLSFERERKLWCGWAADGAAVEAADFSGRPRPWSEVLDDSRAPFYRWFMGGRTNACFNEVDRHVLAGRGRHAAFIFESDEWDPKGNDGRGEAKTEREISYRALLYETVRAAVVLDRLGLRKGDRVAFNLPNIPEQIFYTEAAKRLGIIFTPVFGGFSEKTLSDRIADSGARVVITCDGGYYNGKVVPYKSQFVDPALRDFIRVRELLNTLALAGTDLPKGARRLYAELRRALETLCAGEITVERENIETRLAEVLSAGSLRSHGPEALRTALDGALAGAGHKVENVVVIQHIDRAVDDKKRDSQESRSEYLLDEATKHILGLSPDKDPRESWSKHLLDEATKHILAKAGLKSESELLALDDVEFWRALAASSAPEPVEADWPLFIIYTSGSTGKPKGVVHVHGSWLAGLLQTMRVVFDVRPDDRIYTVADPGWITGQSYLIAAPLAAGITSVQVEGSPLYPQPTRFASVIERHRVTLFKAGSTFLKAIMRDPASSSALKSAHSRGALASLRVGTFCAEPVSPVVQQFARDTLCKHYINSYWATEHGGIVLSCAWTDREKLASDAKCWPLPWIDADVRVPCSIGESLDGRNWREPGLEPTPEDPDRKISEKGEIVITNAYPYMARTIWGDSERLGSVDWAGDLERFTDVYFSRWTDGLVYTQGDWARSYDDGSFTLHGRSDDVINVSGHRIGTEEIEGAILRDKLLHADSPVGNAIVVGAPDDVKGQIPVVFLILAQDRNLTTEDRQRLNRLVRSEKGAIATPSAYITVREFPETRSGKYMRRMLQALLENRSPGDDSTLRNPEIVKETIEAIAKWRAGSRP